MKNWAKHGLFSIFGDFTRAVPFPTTKKTYGNFFLLFFRGVGKMHERFFPYRDFRFKKKQRQIEKKNPLKKKQWGSNFRQTCLNFCFVYTFSIFHSYLCETSLHFQKHFETNRYIDESLNKDNFTLSPTVVDSFVFEQLYSPILVNMSYKSLPYTIYTISYGHHFRFS